MEVLRFLGGANAVFGAAFGEELELVFYWRTVNFVRVYNIIARATLLMYCREYPRAANALQEWYHEFVKCSFKDFNELKLVYGNASLVGDERIVLNIAGNKYRLVVRVVFEYKVVQVKWFGTHQEYDNVDVTTVQFKK